MSRTNEAIENPNQKMPEGEPLDPNTIVPDGDAGDETETEKVNREEAGLPNKGLNPEYDEDGRPGGL